MERYTFENADQDYSLRGDIGTQAALNDLNRAMFWAYCSFPNEDAAWADMRKSEWGRYMFEQLMSFDEFTFNGSAEVKEDEDE